MLRKTTIATLFASLLAAGTAFAHPGHPTTTPMPAPAVRPVLVRPAPTTVWTKLGEAMVSGRSGNAILTFDRRGEIVKRLRIDVKSGQASLRAVRVTFANGTEYVAHLPGKLSAHERPAIIDLPGEARAVKSVELIAAHGHKRSRAVVEVSGDRARFVPYARR